MGITAAAIKNNRVTVVILLVLVLAGITTYQTMPRDEDPGFIIRTALVTTHFPGASPERIEQLITDKIEKAVQEMPELDFVNSLSKTGVSIVYVNIRESYSEMRPIWDSLRRKIDDVAGDMPDGARGPYVDDEFGDVFGTIFTITGEGFSYAELKEVADEARDELLYIDEVAKVQIIGAQEERIFVEYNNARLAELGVAPSQLQAILASRNVIFPGGDVTTGRERIVLEPSGNFESVEELERTVITLPGGTDVVYLQDIARIYRGYVDPPAAIMRSTGTRSLGLAINLREGGNIIRMGEEVTTLMHRLEEQYPIGIEFDVVAYQPKHVQKKIREFSGSLGQAVLIVLLVMLVSLGLRTGLVVASLIPMAMISAIFVMNLFDIWLDQMSLAALIIALGMLVDNAIVMSESIMVQMAAGKRPVDAAVDSARELRIPLLVSSLTTAAAFLPIFLAESSTGEYTAPLFKVVTITLLCSWALSLTMTPMFCVYFLRVKPAATGGATRGRWYGLYRKGLLLALKRPIVTVVIVVLVFIGAMQLFRFVPNIFFPPNDKPIFTAEFTLPVGTPIERTATVVDEIEAYTRSEFMAGEDGEGIINWSTYIGQGAPRFVLTFSPEPSKPEYGMMVVNCTSAEVMPGIIEQIRVFCFEHYPDMVPKVQRLQLGAPINAPVEVRVSSRDPERLWDFVADANEVVEAAAGTENIRDDWGPRSKKILVNINQPRARRAGVSSQDVALSLQTALSGLVTTEYREDDKVIPVTLRSVAADRQDIGKIESINVFSPSTGRSVPLKQVADVEVVWQPAIIKRRDQLRTVTVEADIAAGHTAIAATREIDAALAERAAAWGLDGKYELGGELEGSVKANESIGAKLPIAGFFILLLLITQFNSIRRTAIILLTIPLGLIGVVIGLLVARSYFGFMTFLGVISLAGIVINNAIVLIDRIKIEIDENGLDPAHAVLEAAQKRLRPILLTTATTIGGLLPLWISGGVMYEPMAIALIFGLAFATLLTLGVVPVLYSLFFRVSYRDFDGGS